MSILDPKEMNRLLGMGLKKRKERGKLEGGPRHPHCCLKDK